MKMLDYIVSKVPSFILEYKILQGYEACCLLLKSVVHTTEAKLLDDLIAPYQVKWFVSKGKNLCPGLFLQSG